jgi:UDP-glucose 4-epimerase
MEFGMRILITGGAGFVGSHVADRCLDREHEVAIIDNMTTGKPGNVPDNAWAINASIMDNEALYFVFGFHPDVIVHAAASYANPLEVGEHIRTNITGTNVMVETAKYFQAKLIYFQTSLCYGTPRESPITLQHPINPENSYAISKTAAERYIINSDVDFVSFRLANVYGPRNLSGPIPTFYKNITEGKKSIVKDTRRDFVYIDDLVTTVMEAIGGMGMGVFHVSTGHSHSIASIYNAVSMQIGKVGVMEEQKAAPDDVSDLVLTPNSLYPKPSTPMEVGLRKTVEWYKKNPVKETYTHLKALPNAS